MINLNNVFDITINYSGTSKKNIYVSIHGLLKQKSLLYEYIAYETKINGKIPNLVTDYFVLNFVNINNNDTVIGNCYFLKNENTNLLLLCDFNSNGAFKLQSITAEIILNDINYKYNFIIIPGQNNDSFEIFENRGIHIYSTYPNILNFTLEDSLEIKYILNTSLMLDYQIKLNPD